MYHFRIYMRRELISMSFDWEFYILYEMFFGILLLSQVIGILLFTGYRSASAKIADKTRRERLRRFPEIDFSSILRMFY